MKLFTERHSTSLVVEVLMQLVSVIRSGYFGKSARGLL